MNTCENLLHGIVIEDPKNEGERACVDCGASVMLQVAQRQIERVCYQCGQPTDESYRCTNEDCDRHERYSHPVGCGCNIGHVVGA